MFHSSAVENLLECRREPWFTLWNIASYFCSLVISCQENCHPYEQNFKFDKKELRFFEDIDYHWLFMLIFFFNKMKPDKQTWTIGANLSYNRTGGQEPHEHCNDNQAAAVKMMNK